MRKVNSDLFNVAKAIRVKILRSFPLAEIPDFDLNILKAEKQFNLFYDPCHNYVLSNGLEESEWMQSKLNVASDHAKELENILKLILKDETEFENFTSISVSVIPDEHTGINSIISATIKKISKVNDLRNDLIKLFPDIALNGINRKFLKSGEVETTYLRICNDYATTNLDCKMNLSSAESICSKIGQIEKELNTHEALPILSLILFEKDQFLINPNIYINPQLTHIANQIKS